MKNKKILAILALTVTLSGAMTACSFGGGDPDDQEVVTVTPTPEPTKAPQPTPTIVPQDLTYTSADKSVSIKLPDATWARKTDESGMLSFESPDQGKILILHGEGADQMEAAIIPSTQDMAATLEKASDMEEGTDFEIQNYTANDVNGVGVYSYTVKYSNKEKSGGYAYVVNKVFANDNEYYTLTGSVKEDGALDKISKSIGSFKISGDSTLKGAASGQDANANGGNANGNGDGAQGGENSSSGGSQGGLSEDALSDTNQTRTIYRNSDGQPLVITADGNGNWVDDNGNTYDFVTDEDVYDQDGVDYYYHGEAADVYYMPVDGGSDDSYDEDYE